MNQRLLPRDMQIWHIFNFPQADLSAWWTLLKYGPVKNIHFNSYLLIDFQVHDLLWRLYHMVSWSMYKYNRRRSRVAGKILLWCLPTVLMICSLMSVQNTCLEGRLCTRLLVTGWLQTLSGFCHLSPLGIYSSSLWGFLRLNSVITTKEAGNTPWWA